MSQNTIIIPTTGTLSGLTAVQDMNAALDSLQTNFSGPSEPATKQAYMWWADTTAGLLKIRNAANTAWITIGPLTLARFGSQEKTTVASAATPDIWTGTGDLIDYTGIATATGFAAAPQAGAWRKLICAAAAVFTAGANLIINGVASGNYTAAAGDVIFVFAITTTQFRLTIQKADGTAVVGTAPPASSVGTGQLKTATGIAQAAYTAGILAVVMNDYSFSPNETIPSNFDVTGLARLPWVGVDPADTIGRFRWTWSGGTGGTMTIRWRYMTASDRPTVWIAHDAAGTLVGVWVSDDPASIIGAPLDCGPAATVVPIDTDTLSALGVVTPMHYAAADAWITAQGYSPLHREYRAFQQMTGQSAPGAWLMSHAKMDIASGSLILK